MDEKMEEAVIDLQDKQLKYRKYRKNKPEFLISNPLKILNYIRKTYRIPFNYDIQDQLGSLKLEEIKSIEKYFSSYVFIYNCVANLPVGSYFGELGLLKN